MQPLLKIQSVPINIEYKVQRAALQTQSTKPQVNITRSRGGLNIQTRPAKVNIDTYEARASAGLKSAPRAVQEAAQNGMATAQEVTRRYAEEGNQVVDTGAPKSHIADMVANRINRPAETVTAFIPSVRPEISVDPGSISIDFSMDKLSFDWNINNRPQLEYVPGNIAFSVTQYPQLLIEYVGPPIYVPRSADPNYEPPAVEVDASV